MHLFWNICSCPPEKVISLNVLFFKFTKHLQELPVFQRATIKYPSTLKHFYILIEVGHLQVVMVFTLLLLPRPAWLTV